MIIVISPAKSVDFDTPSPTGIYSQPEFVPEATKLIKKLNTLSGKKLGELMNISKDLVSLNQNRYQNWTPTPVYSQTKQAMLAFNGEVFRGLDATQMNDEDFEFAQQHLRILSGLYGVLRPLDLIQPYRLEMGTKLKHYSANNLYQFWGDKITKRLNADLGKNEVLVNLASTEYFKSIQLPKLKARVITPIFKDFSNGQYKVLMTYAKNARGTMTNFIIKNRLTNPDDIKAFDSNGYAYSAQQSSESEWVFLRG